MIIKLDLISSIPDCYNTITTTTKDTSFVYGTCMKTGHILGHKTSFKKFQKIKIT